MFLNQYASILNGPPRLGGFRLGEFAGGLDDMLRANDRNKQIQELANQASPLSQLSIDLSNQALKEFDPVKRAAIRKQEFDLDSQVSDFAKQMMDLQNQNTREIDPSAMTDEQKAKMIKDATDHFLAGVNSTEQTHKFLLAADVWLQLPQDQKYEGSPAESTYVAAANNAIDSTYQALKAGDAIRQDATELGKKVDEMIATAAQKALEHPVVTNEISDPGIGWLPADIVSQPVATSTNDIATAAKTAISVTSTTAAPVFSNPTIATPMVAIPAPAAAKSNILPLIGIGALAFLLGKI
jgi:hypothetical protein